MKRVLGITGVLVFLTIICPAIAEDTPDNSEEKAHLILPAGTPVSLVLLEGLSSQRNRAGDEIVFALTEDIVLMDQTYLCAGTPVIGRVNSTRPARSWGRQGIVDIEIIAIAPLYNMPIPVALEFEEGGGSNKARAISAGIAFGALRLNPIGILTGAAYSGNNAVAEAGRVIIVFTAEDGTIKDIPEGDMRSVVDEWYRNKVIKSFLSYRWDKNKTISEAMASMGYTIDESMITVEEQDNYYYSVSVQISPTEVADFTFRPFEEAYGGKFITLEAINDLAKQIMKAVK